MRVFIKYFALFMSVGLTMLCLFAAAAVWAAGTEKAAQVIGEGTQFTWPIVLMLIIAASGFGGNAALVAWHMKNSKIHRDYEAIAEDFVPRTECELIHKRGK